MLLHNIMNFLWNITACGLDDEIRRFISLEKVILRLGFVENFEVESMMCNFWIFGYLYESFKRCCEYFILFRDFSQMTSISGREDPLNMIYALTI